MIFALINEICLGCGAQNRWWISKRGLGEDYINWLETGLCPRCNKEA